jgi:SAM-dependent methyltransferase
MKLHDFTIRFFSVIIIVLLSASLNAQQNNTNSGFVPEVGQKGKDVVWVPTPNELVDLMLSMAKVTPDDYVIDLGAGDGRIAIAAAKLGANALGIEFNPDMVALSRKNAENAGVSNKATFLNADLFECDLSKATVITMFLLPELNLRLRPRLLEMKPGTRIVSNTFTMGEWDPDYEKTTEDNWNSWNTALLWIIPAKVNGIWKLGNEDLSIKQEFQMIYGSLTEGGKSTSLTDGRLSGNQITFKIGDRLYIGTVDGGKMSGNYTTASVKADWVAIRQNQ